MQERKRCPRSLPALWSEAITPPRVPLAPEGLEVFADADLVPAYRLGETGSPTEETARLADTLALLAERLSRLEEAYHAWQPFEPGPYFDLYPQQVAAMCHWQEQGGQVHFTLYGDWLIPAFRRAVQSWCRQQQLAGRLTRASQGQGTVPPEGGAGWQRGQALFWRQYESAARMVSLVARRLYEVGNVDFLSSHAALDERQRVADCFGDQAAVVLAQLHDVPTLTLARSFLVEPRRQPGRQQRLARQRLVSPPRRF